MLIDIEIRTILIMFYCIFLLPLIITLIISLYHNNKHMKLYNIYYKNAFYNEYVESEKYYNKITSFIIVLIIVHIIHFLRIIVIDVNEWHFIMFINELSALMMYCLLSNCICCCNVKFSSKKEKEEGVK